MSSVAMGPYSFQDRSAWRSSCCDRPFGMCIVGYMSRGSLNRPPNGHRRIASSPHSKNTATTPQNMAAMINYPGQASNSSSNHGKDKHHSKLLILLMVLGLFGLLSSADHNHHWKQRQNHCWSQWLFEHTRKLLLEPQSLQNPNVNAGNDIPAPRLKFPIDNVLLMGQFNYNPPQDNARVIRTWVEIWSQYFTNIVVTGPFSDRVASQLRQAGIAFHIGRNDAGFVSPYENLMHVLLKEQQRQEEQLGSRRNSSTPFSLSAVEAVLYVHDDILLNLTQLALHHGGESSIEPADRDGSSSSFLRLPTNRILASFDGARRMQTLDYYNITVVRDDDNDHRRLQEQRIGSSAHDSLTERLEYSSPDHTCTNSSSFTSKRKILQHLSPWSMNRECLEQRSSMIQQYFSSPGWRDDNYAASSNASTTTFSFSSKPMQSDILLIPLQFATAFAHAARPHAAHSVFLECAVPTILEWMKHPRHHPKKQQQQQQQAMEDITRPGARNTGSEGRLSLCTTWDHTLRSNPSRLMRTCAARQEERRQQAQSAGRIDDAYWQVYHPIKLRQTGAARYLQLLDELQQ